MQTFRIASGGLEFTKNGQFAKYCQTSLKQ